MQRGVEERNFAERAGHLESLREKKKSDNNQDFWVILFWLCWKYQTCANTHTPLMSSSMHPHAHTHMHTHTIARIGTDAEMLSCTHTFLVSHPAIVAQHHNPWCFTAVFPGTELSLVQSRLNKNSSHFQLGEEGFFFKARSETHPTPPAFKSLHQLHVRRMLSCENQAGWSDRRNGEENARGWGEREREREKRSNQSMSCREKRERCGGLQGMRLRSCADEFSA